MSNYVCLGIIFFAVGILLIAFYFLLKFIYESYKPTKMQTEGLNVLLTMSYEAFQHFLNIKTMLKNKKDSIKKFLDSPTSDNATNAFTLLAPPPLDFNVNIGNYSFTISNNTMICDLILKFVRTANDTFGDIEHFNRQFKLFDGIQIDSEQSLQLLEIHLKHTLPQIMLKANLGIYTIFRLMEEVSSYNKFLGKKAKLMRFYDVDDIENRINIIIGEINAALGNVYWQKYYNQLSFQNISKFKILNCIFKIIFTAKKFFSKNSYEFVPAQHNFDLVMLEDFIQQSVISEFITKNSSYMHTFGMVEDLSKDGFLVQTPNNTAKIILGREFEPSLYRGENRDYGNFSSSFLRIDDTKNPIKHCVEYIKREEFKRAFSRTSYYRIIQKFRVMGYPLEVDLDAVAQHYEFSTNYLDVTKNVQVALFFAYTQYHNGKYFPIDNFDELDAEGRPFTPILYTANFANIILSNPILSIVGFQGVLRPQKQLAMALNISNSDDKNIISNFRKIILPRDRDISYAIYNSFNKGKDLFPDEPISEIRQIILNQSKLREDLFIQYCQKFNKNENQLKNELYETNYTIENWEVPIMPEMEARITKDIYEKMIPWIKEKISYRRIKRPKKNEESYFIDLYPLKLNK